MRNVRPNGCARAHNVDDEVRIYFSNKSHASNGRVMSIKNLFAAESTTALARSTSAANHALHGLQQRLR